MVWIRFCKHVLFGLTNLTYSVSCFIFVLIESVATCFTYSQDFCFLCENQKVFSVIIHLDSEMVMIN